MRIFYFSCLLNLHSLPPPFCLMTSIGTLLDDTWTSAKSLPVHLLKYANKMVFFPSLCVVPWVKWCLPPICRNAPKANKAQLRNVGFWQRVKWWVRPFIDSGEDLFIYVIKWRWEGWMCCWSLERERDGVIAIVRGGVQGCFFFLICCAKEYFDYDLSSEYRQLNFFWCKYNGFLFSLLILIWGGTKQFITSFVFFQGLLLMGHFVLGCQISEDQMQTCCFKHEEFLSV